VRARIEAGAAFAIVGTLLVEAPDAARALVELFGTRIVAGVDARGTQVAVRGWQSRGGVQRDDLLREVQSWGIERVVVTEISRDGSGTGYDYAALAVAAAAFPLKFTASGGARDVADLRALRAATPANVDQAIVGRALYEGTLDLAEALAALA